MMRDGGGRGGRLAAVRWRRTCLPVTAAFLLAFVPVAEAAAADFSVARPGARHASMPEAGDVYVARRGWHIDIGFATAGITAAAAPAAGGPAGGGPAPLRAVASQFPGAQFLFFGFGDRRYLLARSRGVPTLIAALWPGQGLLLVTGLSAPPEQAFGEDKVLRLHLSLEQSRAAQRFLGRSLAGPASIDPDQEWTPQQIASGPYPGSLYFSTAVEYSALHTCNTWAAEVLRSAGLRVHSRGVIFAGQVWRQARRLADLR